MIAADSCPVCASTQVEIRDRLDPRSLVSGYRERWLDIDIARLFEQISGDIELCVCGACDLRWYANAPAGDSRFYEALQRHPWYYDADKAEFTFAGSRVAAEDRVLEVGCGVGAFARHIGKAHFRGLEFNEKAVDAARKAGLDVELRTIQDEARERPGVYDIVCSFQVIEHVSDPLVLMQSCVRALKKGGQLMISAPAEDSFVGQAESDWLNMPPHHLTRWSDRALERLLHAAGVEPVETWHEPVAQQHQAWQRRVVAAAGWKSWTGGRPRLVGRPWPRRLLKAAFMIPSVGNGLYRRGLDAHPEADRGHTVCVIGLKKAA